MYHTKLLQGFFIFRNQIRRKLKFRCFVKSINANWKTPLGGFRNLHAYLLFLQCRPTNYIKWFCTIAEKMHLDTRIRMHRSRASGTANLSNMTVFVPLPNLHLRNLNFRKADFRKTAIKKFKFAEYKNLPVGSWSVDRVRNRMGSPYYRLVPLQWFWGADHQIQWFWV